eukprot:XP_001695953.1 predicted protein [Chlamydomonas reinhardtii]
MELLLLATLDSGLTAHSFLHVFACSCAYNTSGSREQAFAKVVSRSYALCVEGNGTSGASGTDQQLQVMVPTRLFPAYSRLGRSYSLASSRSVAVIPVDEDQLLQEALFEFSNKLNTMHDAWILQMSVPLDGSAPMMLYRTDLFAAAGLSRPPATWAEVLTAAAALNGTDMDGDGEEDFALCFRPDPDCSYTSALGMVLLPYLQYNGTATGGLLAPEDLQPLLDTPGAAAALAVFKSLLAFHIPLDLQGIECAAGDVALAFAEGECAMAFGWGELFKLSEISSSAPAFGGPADNSSAASALGQRTAKGRYAMTPLPGSTQVYDRQRRELVECGSAAQCPYGAGGLPETVTTADGRTLYVNRAPYLPYTGVVGLVAAAVDPERQRRAFDFLTYLSAANLNLSLASDNPIVPFRTNALTTARIPDFVAAGFDEAAVRSYMSVVNATVNHPNLAPGPIIPRGDMLRALMGVAAANLTQMPAVSLAVPVASAVVVLLLSTLYEFKKHRQHRSLFGKVVAPGPFEDTTLLVTDIQCLRKLLLKHSGYESATEGDSFLLAFHSPEDALLFAMEAQVALLECGWPMELLDCDVCRPAYVAHNDSDKRANLLADAGDPGGGGGGLMALPRASSGLSNKSTSEEASSPQASHGLSSGAVVAPGESNTFLTACQASWKEATAATPNNVLIFRGLRVRMGMHTGISNEADVAYNKAAARMQYSGEILNYGKSVTGRRLMGRLGHLSGMRFKEQLSRGVFTAPLGAVAMVYVGVAGVPALLAWDEPITREALALLHACLAEHVRTWGGYLVEAADEQVHVVFPAASDAVMFCLAAHQAAMELPWPEPLLDHELAEELIVGDAVVLTSAGAGAGVMGGTPRGTSAGVAFPFTSARRLLPSWGSTGQGHSSQDVAAVVATSIPANRGGASNSSNSHPYITDADAVDAAALTTAVPVWLQWGRNGRCVPLTQL